MHDNVKTKTPRITLLSRKHLYKGALEDSVYLTIIHRSGGKYPPLSLTLRWIIVFVYTKHCFGIYQTSWITSGPKSNFIYDNMPTKAILFFLGCLKVNTTWLINSELANQRARKVLFTLVYTNIIYCQCIKFNGST